MSDSEPARRPAASAASRTFAVVDPLLLFVLCAVVYGLLRQDTFYRFDGWADLRRVGAGDPRSEMHLLYKPGLMLCWSLLNRLGVTLYESATWFSSLGSAAGVALFHAATLRLGVSRTRALWVGLCCATAPAVVFFATVVERHGPFLAYAGLSAYAAAWFATRPGVVTALGLGLGCTLAYAAHSTGVLLVAVLVPLALVEAARRRGAAAPFADRRLLALAVLSVATTAVTAVLARQLALAVGQSSTGADNLAFLLQHAAAHVRDPLGIPVNLWQEWIWPFLPVSLTWLLVFRRGGDRLVGVATAVGLATLGAFAFLIVGRLEEHGAYLLPVVWPAALSTVRALPSPRGGRALAGIVAVAAVLAFVGVRSHDDHRDSETRSIDLDAVAQGYRAIASQRPVYHLVADAADFELLLLHRPDVFPYPPRGPLDRPYWDLRDAVALAPPDVERGLPFVDRLLAAQLDAGRQLLITRRSVDFLEDPPDWLEHPRSAVLLLEHLRSRFLFEPVRVRGFDGFRIVRRE